MALRSKTPSSPRQDREKTRMHPKRFIFAKEKEDIEKLSLARREPGKFALQNNKLIYSGIRRHNLDFIKGVEREDLEQECLISLIKSAQKWFPPRGEFSTFAIANMANCKRILERSHALVHFPEDERNRIIAFRKWKRYNPGEGTEEFADYMGISLGQAREIEWNSEIHKNSMLPKDGSALLYGEMPPNDGKGLIPPGQVSVKQVRRKMEHYSNPVSSIEHSSMKSAISSAMSSLNDSERSSLEARFGLNGTPQKTVSEIAGELKLSREKARSFLQLATRKLKNRLERHGLSRELLDQD
ncbi:sigma-70 family RNA polymerase sigma factor [Candidatus Micrarchaeota archaeon]|nr:sigma-70 family RNA polymerase sigma factor [Candidatus Micrarchaeota archaeon]